MGSLRQIYLTKTGNQSLWEVRQKTQSKPLTSGHIRIQVQYSGLNFADVMMGLGMYPDAPDLPYIPGYEMSGVITALGDNVSGFSVGQRVCGGSAFGGMQSSVDLPQEQVIALPSHLNLEQGASLIVSFITAYAVFCQLARVRAGDRVLIDCGTGALGRTSIELLQHLGIDQITALTRSPEKLKYLQEMGVQGRLHQDIAVAKYDKSFDVILNSQGGRSLRQDYRRLSACGRMVSIGASSLVNKGKKNIFTLLKEMWGMRGFFPITLMNDNRGVMGLNALRLFDENKLITESLKFLKENPIFHPHVDRVFSAHEVNEALSYLGKGRSRGKVLLKW